MLEVSQNFKNDLISFNQKLKPVLIITDADNDILFTLTQDKDNLFDNSGNLIRTINCISKVSNVKISTEFDSKKLKINRLRCTLYNYYDINTKLTEYINTGIIGKNLLMFYKSPSTNVIDLQDQLQKPNCPLIYSGEINRFQSDDSTINISVEDKTQIKIADKSVPYLSFDKLPLEQREKVLPDYRDNDNVVPMTFGAVDKAPVLPYLENNNDRVLNLLLDFHPTASNYKTAKIPKLLVDPPKGNFCLYVKKDEDYIILDHDEKTVYDQTSKFSKLQLYSFNFSEQNYLFPSIRQTNDTIGNIWEYNGFSERLVDSAYASDGAILNAQGILAEDLNNQNFQRLEKINDNNNFEKKWYRQTGIYNSGDNIINDNFYGFATGVKYYGTDSIGGAGRWIILKLSKGISNNLISIDSPDITGNTFFMADWELYQHPNRQNVPNNASLGSSATDNVTRTGFFIAPLSADVWKDGLTYGDEQNQKQSDLNRLLLQTDEDKQLLDDDNALLELYAPKFDAYLNAPMFLMRNEPTAGGSNYWGTYNYSQLYDFHEYRKIQGLYYGIDNDTEEKHNADEHDLVAIFEYFPPYWEGSKAYQQGLRMDNIALLHSVAIENLQEEEIYASIVGRKNNFFTEQLESTQTIDTDVNIDNIIYNSDGSQIDENILLNGLYETVNNVLNAALEEDVAYFERARTTVLRIYVSADVGSGGTNFSELKFGNEFDAQVALNEILSISYSNINYNAPILNNNLLLESIIWKVITSPLLVYDLTGATTDGVSYNNLFNQFNDAGSGSINYEFLIQNQDFIKSVCAKIYQYILQKDIDYNNFVFQYANKDGIQNIDITDSVNTLMQNKNWNDYTNNNVDEYFNNMLLYFDDLIFALCESIRQGVLPFQYNESILSFNLDAEEIFIDNYQPTADFLASFNFNTANYLSANFPILTGFLDEDNIQFILTEINTEVVDYAQAQIQGLIGQSLLTNGVIEKPSDIVMNILVNEMGYGKLNTNEVLGQDIITPDYTKFDMDSIIESREVHQYFKMGFSVKEKTEGKKLIEEVLKESQSYPRFTSDGKFGLLTIKQSYTYEDIDKIIDINDIISYKFEQTKREDITTSVKMLYRFDYGQDKYTSIYETNINEIDSMLEYQRDGFNSYNIDPVDSHKEIELKYHTDKSSVVKFSNYTILNNCNPHNVVNLKLPLNYMDLAVGDKIHLPLINNEKVFNTDYSKVSFKNGQAIYPLWLIMETNIGTDSISLKAVQLHYLGLDSNHKFVMPNEEYVVRGNTKQFSNFNFTNGEPIPNTNYDSLANQDNGIETPFFDLNNDGLINVVDISVLIQHITGGKQLTQKQKDKLVFNGDGTPKQFAETIDVIDVVSMVNIILG